MIDISVKARKKPNTVRAFMPKYQLPPLVFYETHADNSVSTFIIDNLDYFQKVGYKTICVELEVGQTLDDTIQQISGMLPKFVQQFNHMNSKDPKYQTMLAQMRTVSGKQLFFLSLRDSHFIFRGIDMPVPDQIKHGLNSPQRNSLLTANIIKNAKEFDGAIIVITGLGHYSLQQLIKKDDPENAEQYLWVHLHNPTYATDARQALVSTYEREGYDKYFPLGLSIFQSSNEQLSSEIKKAISKKCYTYEDEDLDTSTARILKSVIGSDVSAHFRADGEKYVDALIPLKKAAENHHQEPEQFLTNLTTTLKNVRYEVQGLSSASHSKKESYVIIREINTREVAESITELKTSLKPPAMN
ncbi:hypothetical protein [Legionella maioricensis]|uniref:Uncharacterized protein n=1 Tax=Legionella maioricensis TaxID=2896528 RepID=A0A9X2D220_9GAMM|nr:hypothetical protein [Legionella maioricensis]MCL9684991.1 hypothetical protein [Legionella maioricensis]MCL9688112.1 hypothetical protein [Legionella maioricensis]